MVKYILKRNNILLSQFANDLNISRPTLDSYIKNYDNGIKLSNEMFQKIFNYLFKDMHISNEEFKKKYQYVITNYGMIGFVTTPNKKQKNTILEELISNGEIFSYLSSNELNALGDLIKGKDVILKSLLNIEWILSGGVDINKLSEKEKMIIVKMYEVYGKLKELDYSYDKASYDKLINSINKKTTSINKEELKKTINDKISAIINDAIEQGDVDKIKDLLSNISNTK